MSQKQKYYQVSLSRSLHKRIIKLFEDFPNVETEYKRGNNPGHVKFIEEAIRFWITRKEEFELTKMRELGKRESK